MKQLAVPVAIILTCLTLTQGLSRGRKLMPLKTENLLMDDPPVPVPEHWFHQKLDHFDPADNRVWQQRYYINDTFYQPGGPMFLSIGGEAELPEIYARTGDWMVYAEKYHALCFAVEHRYYGQSRPTADMSTANLQYLTMDQALEDLAMFITAQNKQPNMTNAKWIVFGTSLSGMLSVWMRYKFPHLVAGAVAHSATVGLPVINTEYTVAMGEALQTVPGCFESVTAAFDDIRNKLKTETGKKGLMDLFKMCDFDRNNQLDVENVIYDIMSTLIQVIQFSGDHMEYLTGRPALTVSDMCGVLTDSNRGQPLERFAYYSALLASNYTYLNGSCLPVTFNSVIADGQHVDYNDLTNKVIASNRAWNYQLCTQLGDYIVTVPGSKPFGKTMSEDYFFKTCQGYFGTKFDKALVERGNQGLVMNYAGLNIRATKIVYTQGGLDPFRKVGITQDDIPGSHVIVIPDVGHVAARFSPSPLDSPALTQARTKIQRYIGQWISAGHGTILG